MLTVGLYSNGIFRTFTGKTTLMTALAEWYQEQRLPFVLLDLDTENKARGSVAHFFRDRAQKVNIHTPAGLDALWIIWARRSGWCWPTWARAPDKSPRSGLRTSTKMRRRQHGVTLGQVANRQTAVPELGKASLVMRAQGYCRKLFSEFEWVQKLLLP